MRDFIRSLFRNSSFWWGFVIVNGLFIGAQPTFLILSCAGVLFLKLLVFGIDAITGTGNTPMHRITRWVTIYFVIVLLVAFGGIAAGVAWVPLDHGRYLPDWYMNAVGVGSPMVSAVIVWRVFRYFHPKMKTPRIDYVPPKFDYEGKEQQRREEASRQQRREDARARVELFYNVNAPELKDRYTRAMLDEYISRYMGDDKLPEVVEARAETLMEVIRQHLEKLEPPSAKQSFEDVLAAFDRRKRKVLESSLDPQDKETLLIQLDEEREAAIKKCLREGRL